jgi:hypothetical protein
MLCLENCILISIIKKALENLENALTLAKTGPERQMIRNRLDELQ